MYSQRTAIENDSNQSEPSIGPTLPRIESDTDTGRQVGRQVGMQVGRQVGRQAGRQIDKQVGRQ